MFHPKGPTLLELTKQALSSTTTGYDLLAEKFEYTPFRTPDSLLIPMMQAIGEPGSIKTALDVCCGTGAALRMLRPLCTDYVTGIDLSQGMLDQAKTLLEEDTKSNTPFRLIQKDVLSMDFENEFDVITCCGAFGHIMPPEQNLFLTRVRRALKPGGRFIFITHEMPSVLNKAWWLSRGFNAVMHVRNAILKPPFIMFYLTFPLERAKALLWDHGFHVESAPLQKYASPTDSHLAPHFLLVIATREAPFEQQAAK